MERWILKCVGYWQKTGYLQRSGVASPAAPDTKQASKRHLYKFTVGYIKKIHTACFSHFIWVAKHKSSISNGQKYLHCKKYV